MERKDLTGHKFTGNNGEKYIVIAGYEGKEVAFEENDITKSTLNFCCDAKIINGRLRGSYCVSYTVPKEEFFYVIDGLDEETKASADTIATTLRHKYYKIPIAFLRLVGEAYWKARKEK